MSESHPDLVLVFKGLFVRKESVAAIQALGIPAFCFNPDNPFNPSVSITSRHLREALPAWDCYFTWGRFLIDRLYGIGLRRVEYLPFAWDPDRHPHQEPTGQPKYGASFVGSYTPHRERWLSALTDLDLNIWGPRWSKAAPEVRQHVRGEEMVGWQAFSDIVSDSVVSLNVLDPWSAPGHNMRTYEIPGCGGLQLSSWASETAELFEPDHEILMFRTSGELRDHVSWALRAPDERHEMARRGHARAASASYEERAGRILEVWREGI